MTSMILDCTHILVPSDALSYPGRSRYLVEATDIRRQDTSSTVLRLFNASIMLCKRGDESMVLLV